MTNAEGAEPSIHTHTNPPNGIVIASATADRPLSPYRLLTFRAGSCRDLAFHRIATAQCQFLAFP